MSKKYYYPKSKALISIQFWINKDRIPHMTLTCNDNSNDHVWWPHKVNGRLFAKALIDSENLESHDHDLLKSIFENYLKQTGGGDE